MKEQPPIQSQTFLRSCVKLHSKVACLPLLAIDWTLANVSPDRDRLAGNFATRPKYVYWLSRPSRARTAGRQAGRQAGWQQARVIYMQRSTGMAAPPLPLSIVSIHESESTDGFEVLRRPPFKFHVSLPPTTREIPRLVDCRSRPRPLFGRWPSRKTIALLPPRRS